MTREEIDLKYLKQAEELESETFDIVDGHRRLKNGKTITEFNLFHANIWRAHEAELITEGYVVPLPVTPSPDYKQMWTEAVNNESKLIVLAKILNLVK